MAQAFMLDPIKIIFTVLVAFIPSIVYAIIIRYSEKFEREPWGSIGQAFLWGGTLSIVLVILIRGYFDFHLQENFAVKASDLQWRTLVLMVVITPFAAELIKPIGLFLVRADIMEAEDGLIYGAVIGLGYTATENLLYGIFFAPLYGLEMFITVVFMRSMSVMFIQSSTTALSCYGITRAMKVKHKTGKMYVFPLFLLAAIGIHMAFNYIVFMNLFNVGDILFSMSSSLVFSIVFAFILMVFIYVKIYRLDRIDSEKEESGQVDDFADERPRMAQRQAHPRHDGRPPPDDYPYYDYDPYHDYEREPYPPSRAAQRIPPRARGPPRPPARARGYDYGRAQPPPSDFPNLYEPPTRGHRPPPRPPHTQAPPRPPSPMHLSNPNASRPPRQQTMVQAQAQPTPRPPRTQAPPSSPRPPRSLTTAQPSEPTSEPSQPSHLKPIRTKIPVKTKSTEKTSVKKKEKSLAKEDEIEEVEVETENDEEADVDWDM
jgi:RsiW-degrading membrane proteinase PrsW (M82 family)